MYSVLCTMHLEMKEGGLYNVHGDFTFQKVLRSKYTYVYTSFFAGRWLTCLHVVFSFYVFQPACCALCLNCWLWRSVCGLGNVRLILAHIIYQTVWSHWKYIDQECSKMLRRCGVPHWEEIIAKIILLCRLWIHRWCCYFSQEQEYRFWGRSWLIDSLHVYIYVWSPPLLLR